MTINSLAALVFIRPFGLTYCDLKVDKKESNLMFFKLNADCVKNVNEFENGY